jgi:hypothetical protein
VADLTFQQQLWLSIIDKLALGGVLVGIGYLANTRLESQKSRQALRARMAELRMPKIAKEIERFTSRAHTAEEWLRRTWSEAESLVRLHAAYVEKLKTPLSAEDAQTTVFLLSRTPSDVLAAFTEKMKERRQASTALAKEIEDAWRAMLAEHFWLGTELVDILHRRYREWWYRVTDVDVAFDWLYANPAVPSAPPTPSSFWGKLRNRYIKRRDDRALARLGFNSSEVRTDITRIVDHIAP